VQDLEENEMKYIEGAFVVLATLVFAPVYWLTNWYDNYANRSSQNK
jgi:hypothetical protein